MLTFYKRTLALRRRLSQWVDTSIAWRPAPDGVLVYRRGRLTVACNFLQRPVAIPACGTIAMASAELTNLKDGWLSLPASSAAWLDSLGSSPERGRRRAGTSAARRARIEGRVFSSRNWSESAASALIGGSAIVVSGDPPPSMSDAVSTPSP